MEIASALFLALIGILAIGKGSDWLTDSLVPVARKLGVSGSFVGLILVSAAVSLPEVLVAVYASWKGYPAISLGVILGSIVCNIGCMTGISAMVRPLRVDPRTILRDGIFSIVVPILVFAVASGGEITRIEGFAFFLLFIPYVINVYLHERYVTAEEKQEHLKEVEIELQLLGFDFGKIPSGSLSFGLGIAVLLIGAQVFANQLITIATLAGIGQLFIGITLGAIGPSIPNILASYQAARRDMGDVSVSETLGSNIFTLLVTLGITAMLSPIRVAPQWITFDLPAMILMSFFLLVFIIRGKAVTRGEGVLLFGGYLVILGIQSILSLR